ncbi:GNAT family N-acetyltransferase [Candidatus Dojkabacteria bacterium]|nr:GNAT family N-acetyltransferase [Candidatus Dojkabacteria bacterium]
MEYDDYGSETSLAIQMLGISESYQRVELHPKTGIGSGGERVSFNVVEKEGRRIVGTAWLKVSNDAVIQEFGIFAQGYGNDVMGALVRIAEQVGITSITGSTTHDNTAMIRLFDRWGFKYKGNGGEGLKYESLIEDILWN